jgi:hypothetical protein
MFKETIEIWKHILSMNNFKIVILGYCIHFFGSIVLIGVQCPIPITPCNFEKLCIGNYACPNCLNKVIIFLKVCSCTLQDKPHPHARIPMVPNKILKDKHTNKGHLTYSICWAWTWNSSHFNFTFFFTHIRALFSFHFCLTCGLLNIRAFKERWSCCLGPLWQLDGHLNLPICIQRECVHSKCLQNNHLAA